MAGISSKAVERAASRLKFPQAFGIFLALFLLDLVLPDLVPFVDEILLGLGATLFGLWRERISPTRADSPPEKNVTPPRTE